MTRTQAMNIIHAIHAYTSIESEARMALHMEKRHGGSRGTTRDRKAEARTWYNFLLDEIEQAITE